MTRAAGLRARFLDLHTTRPTPHGVLVMPNAWDVGSARILVECGAAALATTSSGHAASLGRLDGSVTRDELLAHVAALSTAVDVPLSVDAEDCFPADAGGVEQTARSLATTDAAGFSIEDYDRVSGTILPRDVSAARVAQARAGGGDLVLTARAENLIRGVDDLDDTIERLVAYRAAGADVVYAPGLATAEDVARVVSAVACPVNVLARPGGPTVRELAAAGAARISVGGSLAWAAYGELARAARELLTDGTSTYAARMLPGAVRDAAFS